MRWVGVCAAVAFAAGCGGSHLEAASSDDAGADAGARSLAVDVALQDDQHDALGVDAEGTIFALALADSDRRIYASTDGGRSFAARGALPIGDAFNVIAPLGGGTLLADTITAGAHTIARSTDRGATWRDVLPLGPSYRILQPHSVAELDGVVYLADYQVAANVAPIHLYASGDGGATWSVRHVFDGYRHAHSLLADPPRHALWALLGDGTGGLVRSLDGGRTFAPVLGSPDGVAVDATVVGEGELLFGRDALFRPAVPAVVRARLDGSESVLSSLPGPSYSIRALAGGGFLVGVTHEIEGDVYPPNDASAHLFGSPDGANWSPLASFPPRDFQDYTRADVYFTLPSGEALLAVHNALGFGTEGRGFQLLHSTMQ